MRRLPVLPELVESLKGLSVLDGLSGPVAKIVGRATASPPVKNLLSGTFLGHPLHPLLTDLPIGTWVSAATLDLVGGKAAGKAARKLTGLGVLAALPTAAAGLSDWSETYGPDQRLGIAHGLGNLAATALQASSYLARRRGRRGLGALLGLSALGLTVGASYLGGHLSFGRGVGVDHTASEERTSEWTRVATLSELETAKPYRVDAGGVPVVVVRDGEALRALSATCVHAGGPLDEGELVEAGTALRCPWHASVFALADGSVLRGPAAFCQPAWEVRAVGEAVEVRFPPAG
ncbi:MAG: Rieske 2Fe-2S domain-containing protein [Acidimicrobiales bacterium]